MNGRFNHKERSPRTHLILSWVLPIASLDDVEKTIMTLSGFELRLFGRPVAGA
jgi:hypothetical protein